MFLIGVVGRKEERECGGGGGGGGVTPFMKYNGRYGEDPPERDTFPAEVSDISKGREFTAKIV